MLIGRRNQPSATAAAAIDSLCLLALCMQERHKQFIATAAAKECVVGRVHAREAKPGNVSQSRGMLLMLSGAVVRIEVCPCVPA
jgi:hypothetical protein